MIIDGRSNFGKTKLLIELLRKFRERETFNNIIIICPTFPKNKTYQNEEFIFTNKNILVCDCDFDDVEQYIKISRCFINSKSNIENALFIFDDIACSEDILKRTSEITKLSYSHYQKYFIYSHHPRLPYHSEKNSGKLFKVCFFLQFKQKTNGNDI